MASVRRGPCVRKPRRLVGWRGGEKKGWSARPPARTREKPTRGARLARMFQYVRGVENEIERDRVSFVCSNHKLQLGFVFALFPFNV